MNYRVGFGIVALASAFTAAVVGLIFGLQAIFGGAVGGALALAIIMLCLALGLSAVAGKL